MKCQGTLGQLRFEAVLWLSPFSDHNRTSKSTFCIWFLDKGNVIKVYENKDRHLFIQQQHAVPIQRLFSPL